MAEMNPFQAPLTTNEPTSSFDYREDDYVLAGRLTRLLAAIIDSFIMMVIVLPLLYFGGVFDSMMGNALNEQSTVTDGLLGSLLGYVVFFVVNGYFLLENGQTVAKKMLSIRIAELDNSKPGIGTLAKRYGFVWIISLITGVGGIISLIDVLFIFRADHRCLHDLVAGTRVVIATDYHKLM